MIRNCSSRNSIEILEARIAPAAVVNLATQDSSGKLYPTIAQAEAAPHGAGLVTAEPGTPVIVHAGQILQTSSGSESGQYLLFVQQGTAEVFFTDFNNNGIIDPNEITGIAAGDGLRLISFVDIHGDIVSNLNPNGTLSDSHNNAALSNSALGGDGRILLNSTIELVEFRSLVQADLLPNENLALRLAPTDYSLYGNIVAGKQFGVANGGLIIDDSQAATVATALTGVGPNYDNPGEPTIGGIYTGSAASGLFFSFGLARGDNQHPNGTLEPFTAANGAAGGDIVNIGATISANGVVNAGVTSATTGTTTAFNIGIVHAGDGGIGGRGGNIVNPTVTSDVASGYSLIAGNGGAGPFGGQGGSIINYSDIGSVTGQVLVQSGDGGAGSTGSGGNGGTITFGSVTIAAGLTVHLGSGGDGFASGGNGSSLLSGSLVSQAYNFVPRATTVVATYHPLDSIGTDKPIDFNGDGVGDIVYATQNPSQLVVMLGDPGIPDAFQAPIYLPMPYTDIDSVAVGDLLGNGHLDIAAVTGNAQTNPGVAVFASTYDTKGQFTGFSPARYSPLPDLFSGDPTQGLQFFFLHANAPVAQVAIGDFAGDHRAGLAVSATYYSAPGQTAHQLVVFMKPDIVPDGTILSNGSPQLAPDGLFYADFGTTGLTPNAFVPFIGSGGSAMDMQATALTIKGGNLHDVIVTPGPNHTLSLFDNAHPSILGPLASGVKLGSVDSNRVYHMPNSVSAMPVDAAHFAILDFNGDGNADFAVLTAQAGYMVTIAGDGKFSEANSTITSGTGDNAGIYFGGPPNVRSLNIGTNEVQIRAADIFDPANRKAPAYSSIAILDFDLPPVYDILEFNLDKNLSPDAAGSFDRLTTVPSSFKENRDLTEQAFDVYTWDLGAPRSVDFVTALPDTTASLADTQGLEVLTSDGFFAGFYALNQNFFHINAGNGGNGLVGSGGNGGNLGGALTSVTTTVAGVQTTTLLGALNITLPFDVTFNGDVVLTGGLGGDGFTSGGQGGNISGITVGYGATATGTALTPVQFLAATVIDVVSLVGGNGGIGVSGAGGSGGNLTANSIDFGELFTAGNGATGAVGGNGGSIIGNGNAGYYDTFDRVVYLTAGLGADGVKLGGSGGNVTNFHPSFNFSGLTDSIDGDYSVIAGDGGSASAGSGGQGGTINNVSPVFTALNQGNYMAGDILLQAGKGGNGAAGGAGGSVLHFIDQPSNTINPALISVLGGFGGKGVSGTGGAGGTIATITIPSDGQVSTNLTIQLTPYNFDRIIAGDGGASSGDVGGAGGSIVNLQTSNTKSGFAIVAGAGGTGLYAGGTGGSLLQDYLQIGGEGGGTNVTLTKALVAAGAGGNATAWLADSAKKAPEAFGGRVGSGGLGGSINGFQQTGGTFVNVDLIAGNGGDTINFDGGLKNNNFVGAGGSIEKISVAGEIGNTEAYRFPSDLTPVLLKSYNDIIHGQSFAAFVAGTFLSTDPLFAASVTLDDNLGSEGIVVGAAGRLKDTFIGYDNAGNALYESQPLTGGTNGNLESVFSFDGIESAVAGSIDRIATITLVQDISVGHGVVGTTKLAAGLPGYLSATGQKLTAPVVGGRLVNGALISSTDPTVYVPSAGKEVPTTLPGNSYVLL